MGKYKWRTPYLGGNETVTWPLIGSAYEDGGEFFWDVTDVSLEYPIEVAAGQKSSLEECKAACERVMTAILEDKAQQ